MRSTLRSLLALSVAGGLVGAQDALAQAIRTDPGFAVNTLSRNDDGSTGLVPLGFTVNFYGLTQDNAYVNNNGNITFDGPLSTYTPFGLAATSQQIIAPFFADVDTRDPSPGVTQYGMGMVDGHNAFGVNWFDVAPFYSPDGYPGLNTFQLVLIDRSDINAGDFDFEFNYSTIAWEVGQASGDSNDNGLCEPAEFSAGCVPAHVGWSNGTNKSFELAGSGMPGAFIDGGSRALASHSLNSSVTGRYLFEVRSGQVVPPPTTAPEPASLFLLGTGLAGVGGVLRRRRRAG